MQHKLEVVAAALEWSEWDEHPPLVHVVYSVDGVQFACTVHGHHMWALTVHFALALVAEHKIPSPVASEAAAHLGVWLSELSPALQSSAGLINDLDWE